MKQQNAILRTNQNGLQAGNSSGGFIILIMIPVFLVLLAFFTAITGCISCSIQAMAHRNEMMQAYSLLEDEDAGWQDEILAAKWKDVYEQNYEKVVSTQKVGPYILLVKEMRNKITGKILVNCLEFIPIDNADEHTS
ncbi:MAG: hypothetical protein IKZ43_00645 [Acidaminococcaceae bacterium]|nr:hypothetical protein [Acidaminococcaceae bacterium]